MVWCCSAWPSVVWHHVNYGLASSSTAQCCLMLLAMVWHCLALPTTHPPLCSVLPVTAWCYLPPGVAQWHPILPDVVHCMLALLSMAQPHLALSAMAWSHLPPLWPGVTTCLPVLPTNAYHLPLPDIALCSLTLLVPAHHSLVLCVGAAFEVSYSMAS